ncbi:metal dependent phosphohydrolase [Xylariaceae sp. AK1471]|nr:metal dependent phosphohydrolase [Xylariaceae sp. AK1471]
MSVQFDLTSSVIASTIFHNYEKAHNIVYSKSYTDSRKIITMSSSPFPYMPISDVSFPHSPITIAAFAYTKQHTTEAVYNHCVRSAYWSLILAKKLAPLQAASQNNKIDFELVVLACILHDMGWSFNKELLSTWKRFEIDGADLARRFVEGYKRDGGEGGGKWDEKRVQGVWDAIALHSTTSIAPFGSAEVATAHLGIIADFVGPRFPSDPWADPSTRSQSPGAVITVEEFREVVRAFPYAGFGEESAKEIFCGLCRDKSVSTFDNFVGTFGREFGLDGKGGGREEYVEKMKMATSPDNFTGQFGYLEGLLREDV